MNPVTLYKPRRILPHRQLPHELFCEIVADGYSLEGIPVHLTETTIWALLPVPLFARLDSTTVVLIKRDGSSVRVTGRVTCQQQIGVGEVLVVIQVDHIPVDVTRMLPQDSVPPIPFPSAHASEQSWQRNSVWKWVRGWVSNPLIPVQDQRVIPRLPIHTTCSVVGKNSIRKGVTRDVSYTGFSVLFSDFSPEWLWAAVFHIKFVKLKATPIGVAHQGRYTVVRFRVVSIHEGENRWRDLHYSYWQHLS